MALVMAVASAGLVRCSCGMMLVLLHDVRILDLVGLMKQPRCFPSSSSVERKVGMSTRGTVAEISSTHAKRWVIPPKPSSPLSPLVSLSWARWRRIVSSG